MLGPSNEQIRMTKWALERISEGCILGLSAVLDIHDSVQSDRLHQAMEGPYGMLSIASQLRDGGSDENLVELFKLIRILLTIRVKCRAALVWLDEKKDTWAWMKKWLKNASLKPALGFSSEYGRHNPKLEILRLLEDIHRDVMCPTNEDVEMQSPDSSRYNPSQSGDTYNVTGSGSPEVNGLYVYESPCQYRNVNKSNIYLYRAKLQSGQLRWYISAVNSKDQNPGTNTDSDYYYAPEKTLQFEDSSPPPLGWVKSSATQYFSGGIDPPPEVMRLVKDVSLDSPNSESQGDEMMDV